MKKINLSLLLLAFIAIIAVILYGARKTPGSGVSQTKISENTVLISNYEYSPKKITVKKGTTISWINKDIAKHTVTVDTDITNGPNSDFFGQGKSYKFTFNKVGTYPYHCEPHPYMKAIVEVIE